MTIDSIHDQLRPLIQKRIDAGRLSVKLLAAQTRLDPATISNFARGRRRLSVHTLSLILAATGFEAEILPKNQPHN